jgi:hypothetical protein
VKVGTPFGEYPFVYRRVERREDGVAIVGTVAGIESTVAVPAAAVALLLLARSRRS